MSIVLINGGTLFSQTTEDFEGESLAASSFTDNSQTFDVTSPTTGETYDVFNCAGCGWNGTTTDAQFIENSSGSNGTNNGSSFTVKPNDGTEIIVSSLYIFCSTTGLANHAGTLTITGWKGGVLQFTITKSTGFSNVATLSPNNGFTYINFVTEGASDYSQTPIDELVFTSTSDLDYMALDAFTWDFASVLSVEDISNLDVKITVYPNPSSEYIQVSNINDNTEFELYSIIGKKLLSGTITQNKKINIAKFENGIYLIKLDGGNIVRFIKR